MEQTINGNIRIADNDYSYFYDKYTEKITINFENKLVSVPENIDIFVGKKHGVQLGGKTLFKLIFPLSNDIMCVESNSPKYISTPSQVRAVDYYIEDYEEKSQYSEIRLQFPELNYFIPSNGLAEVTDEEVVISRKEKEHFSFDFKYQNKEVHISFISKMKSNHGVKVTTDTFSEVRIKFPETNDFEFIRSLYETVRCFFIFICNRQNIGLRNAVLLGSYPTNKVIDGKNVNDIGYKTQKIFFSQKYFEPEECNKIVATTPNYRIFSNQLVELFKLFSNEINESGSLINENSIHRSTKYRNLIDLEQSLRVTATFECYLRMLLPEISSQSTIEFIQDVKEFLDKYIEENTGDKKKKAKKFRNALSPQISLEDKMLKVYEGYSNWESLKPILSEWFNNDITSLADAANSWRNELAHEKREYKPTIDVIKAIRLLEHINYCIVLRKARYSDEEIKIIVEKILKR